MRTLLLAALCSVACVVPRAAPPAPTPVHIPAPVVQGRVLTLAAIGSGLPALAIEADWQDEGDRLCIHGQDARMPTPMGAMELRSAELCVTRAPVSVTGEASVTMPALGFLERAGVQSEGRRARITLALGSQLGSLDVGGQAMALAPSHYYLRFDYQDGLDVHIGNTTISSPGTQGTMIFAPQEPLLYLAGTLAAPYFPTEIKDAGFGISPAGRLPYAPVRPLRDRRGEIDARSTGHFLIQGDVPISGYPARVRGLVVWNVDANGDGRSIFTGELRDTKLAANGTLILGYEKAGFDFDFEVANGSLLYDARQGPAGHLYVSAGDAGGLFDGTPLAVFQPQPEKRDLWGYFRSLDDFAVHTELSSTVAGFAMRTTIIDLDATGIHAAGNLELPAKMGGVQVTGALTPSGLDLRGRADLEVGGFRLANADVSLGGRGVSVAGALAIPAMGSVDVAGSIEPSGSFGLAGTGTVRPAGLTLANAKVAVSPRGADVQGTVSVFGTGFQVRGLVQANGQFALTGRVSANLALVRGHADLTIHPRGFRTTFSGQVCVAKKVCQTVAAYELDTRGRACIQFPKPFKKACIKVM